jgi:enamine deaminase RidA (YjgF/YER057c/UK114 family)
MKRNIMIQRKNISSGTKWEPLVGYSRAVRAGSSVYVSGTTATDENGNIVGIGDPYRQTVQSIQNIRKALKDAGVTLSEVVRTRIYVTDISQWQEIGRAHAEFFCNIRPATCMIQVSALIDPDMLVEMEAEALSG